MSQTIKTILAVDDEPHMLRLLEISLRQAGYKPLTAKDGREALAIIHSQHVDCVVTDLHMPYMSGLQLLKAIRSGAQEDGQDKNKASALANPDLPVIIVTAQGEVKTAIDAMKSGASDYILRPFDLEELELAIARALSFARLVVENQYLREDKAPDAGLVGSSPEMQQLFESIRQVAPEKATVLITGETGTGKELVARAIHAGSPRSNGLFVAVNCASIPHEMLES
jgi:two-component system response regulator AtoC